MNDVKERCTYRELPSNENRHQSIKSVDNQSKQKLSTRNEKFDSNNVWHHVVIEPLIKDKVAYFTYYSPLLRKDLKVCITKSVTIEILSTLQVKITPC